MINKYEIGQEVEVRFIGKITKIESYGHELNYKIESKTIWAVGATENDIFKLPEPEDFKTLKSGEELREMGKV